MNNSDFKQHFINACEHMGIVNWAERIYIVSPVVEEGKVYSGADDVMRLCVLPKQRECTFDEVQRLFTWREGYYPCWIRIALRDNAVLLETSLRMRKAYAQDDKLYFPFRVE